jgi:hypothetical protein
MRPALTDQNENPGPQIRMKPPSLGALLFGLIPFIAICFTVSLWDRIDPRVLGIPFNLFWLTLWLLITPLCMWGAYRLESRRSDQQSRSGMP